MHGFTKSIQINIILSKYGFIWNRFANELRYALSYLLSLSFYCRDLREPISLSSVVEPTLFDLWQTISRDWKSVTWRLTALFTFLVLSSGSRLTDYKHQETNWQDNAHHHTTKPSRNNTPLMVLHSSRGQINKKKITQSIYIYI